MTGSIEDEWFRQRALDGYRVLDTRTEPAYDDIVRLASHICDTPIALISFVDRDRQWFKATVGLDATETPREYAFCDHAIRAGAALMEVMDASADARFAANPLVTGAPDIRFYAGMPLVAPDGQGLGTVCVIDRRARELTPAQRDALAALARLTMQLLDARRERLQAARADTLRNAPAALAPSGHYALAILAFGPVAADGLHGAERAIRQHLSPDDVVSRHGDHELLIVFADAGTAPPPERIRAAAAQACGQAVAIGFSASRSADEAMEEVFLRADEALTSARIGPGGVSAAA